MKNLFILVISSLMFSCNHMEQSEQRLPSSALDKNYQKISQCGELSFNESNREVVNTEDVMYNLALDCNRDRKINSKDQFLAVGFLTDQISSQQKGHITRFTRAAIAKQKKHSAKPYVCVVFQAERDPCLSRQSVMGYNPKFTSKTDKSIKK
ncbi:MAG: hypothetical protein ACK4VO_08920 [Pseudobdellovibrio sp.]